MKYQTIGLPSGYRAWILGMIKDARAGAAGVREADAQFQGDVKNAEDDRGNKVPRATKWTVERRMRRAHRKLAGALDAYGAAAAYAGKTRSECDALVIEAMTEKKRKGKTGGYKPVG